MNQKQFLLLMLIPAIVILSIIAVKYFTIFFGKEILLENRPIDPRDLFRGDYVDLRYEISTIDLNEIPHDNDFSYGDKIYASLSKKKKFWTIDSVSHSKPALDEDHVCMKGKVESVYDDRVFIDWGIETYFVPEGEGWQIERQENAGNVSAVVSVDFTCSSVLRQLLINDRLVRFRSI
jgi:uncharacterized membrane-anchored protein